MFFHIFIFCFHFSFIALSFCYSFFCLFSFYCYYTAILLFRIFFLFLRICITPSSAFLKLRFLSSSSFPSFFLSFFNFLKLFRFRTPKAKVPENFDYFKSHMITLILFISFLFLSSFNLYLFFLSHSICRHQINFPLSLNKFKASLCGI